MLWLSPAFPVGGFAFSHGLEQAAARGWVKNATDLEAWLRDLLEVGSARNDLILLAATWRAVAGDDPAALREVHELALAMQPSAERHLETVTQGNAFLATVRAAWPCAALDTACSALRGDTAYPTAVGAAAAAHRIPLGPSLTAYAIAFTGNLASAAVRLSIIGQTDGQRVLAKLLKVAGSAAAFTSGSTLADIGGSTFRSDIAQLSHETQYTRLFRS